MEKREWGREEEKEKREGVRAGCPKFGNTDSK